MKAFFRDLWDDLTGVTDLRAKLDLARHEIMEMETQSCIDKNIIEVMLWEAKNGKRYDPSGSGSPAHKAAWYDNVHSHVI